ncbi:CtsR family transcriptional regulator [Granulicatella seriolae]|uniref:Transcriptional regulator CtsR n=1 Tax=Granulicatella seriolae TaxID=2967226 RepID=A0ABT1WQC1_9LACT|nr:CtsR family transcriptional regulator [Granulicatella seriolae]
MQTPNMSDLIENYLKNVLTSQEKVEIRRSEIADRFNCVPSQINYVINTRFTVQQGYLVESKRGGGGYIRIMKVNLVSDIEVIHSLLAILQEKLSAKQALHMVHNLYENDIVSKREAELMLVAMDHEVLVHAEEKEDLIRSQMMKEFLNNLKYE